MELPRGMKDFESAENSEIEHLRQHFRRISDLYGFSFMDPSPMELLSVLETKSGPGIKDEIYHFKDKGGRDVALRFDFTVGLTRYAASQKSMRLPAKISAFGGVFRYDEPQKGRYRYFHQWDVEIYGRPSLESEAEVIEITSRMFDSLLLKNITIDISHRRLVESYICSVFDSADQQTFSDMLRAIDKTQKKTRQEILDEFEDRYDHDSLEKILDFSQIKGTIHDIEQSINTAQLASWDYLKQLVDSLENRGVTNTRINFGIVRGLDYYSGMVFEVFDKNSKLGALAGGGRYDSLTKAFGREDIGATGVAGGVERTILAMKEQDIVSAVPQDRIAVLYINDQVQKVALSIASLLRLNGIHADVDIMGKKFHRQMEQASGSRFCIIVGPQEIKEGNVTLKDMNNGMEGTIPLEKLTDDPNSIFNSEKPV